MFRVRSLLIGSVLVSVVACVDHVVGPTSGGYNPPTAPAGPSLESIQGILEQVDDRFGLRQTERLVMIRYSDAEALVSLVGREVVVRGTFAADGEFSATSIQLAGEDDGEAATSWIPAKARGVRR